MFKIYDKELDVCVDDDECALTPSNEILIKIDDRCHDNLWHQANRDRYAVILLETPPREEK